MDEEEVTILLACDIELGFTGPTISTVNQWAAGVLRKLADRVENGEFNNGHYPVKDNVGKKVGTIYVDYSGEF